MLFEGLSYNRPYPKRNRRLTLCSRVLIVNREAFVKLSPRTVLPEVTIPPSVTPGHDVTTLIIDTSRALLPSEMSGTARQRRLIDWTARTQLDRRIAPTWSTRSGRLM